MSYISLSWSMETFPRNPEARSSVVRVFWAQAWQAATTSVLFTADVWDILSCLGCLAGHCHSIFIMSGPWCSLQIMGLHKPQFLNWFGNYSYFSISITVSTIKSLLQFPFFFLQKKKKTLNLQKVQHFLSAVHHLLWPYLSFCFFSTKSPLIAFVIKKTSMVIWNLCRGSSP